MAHEIIGYRRYDSTTSSLPTPDNGESGVYEEEPMHYVPRTVVNLAPETVDAIKTIDAPIVVAQDVVVTS